MDHIPLPLNPRREPVVFSQTKIDNTLNRISPYQLSVYVLSSTVFEMRIAEQYIEQQQFYSYLISVLMRHSAVPMQILKCIAYRYLPEDVFAQFETRMKRYSDTLAIQDSELYAMMIRVRKLLLAKSVVGHWMRTVLYHYHCMNHAQRSAFDDQWKIYKENAPNAEEIAWFKEKWGLDYDAVTKEFASLGDGGKQSSPLKKRRSSRC